MPEQEPARSLGAAYGIQKKNKAKKMAQGGEVKTEASKTEIIRPDKGFGAIIGVGRAEGGMIDDEQDIIDHASIAAAIMAKRKKMQQDADSESDIDSEMMMADGGMVDLNENSQEQPNEYYKRNQAVLKENYDSDMEDMEQPMDSNEHADSEEEMSENEHDEDMVSSIRRKMRTKSPIIR